MTERGKKKKKYEFYCHSRRRDVKEVSEFARLLKHVRCTFEAETEVRLLTGEGLERKGGGEERTGSRNGKRPLGGEKGWVGEYLGSTFSND